jgi:hypothetical protein
MYIYSYLLYSVQQVYTSICIFVCLLPLFDRLWGLVVRVPGYKSKGSGSIRGATTFSKK